MSKRWLEFDSSDNAAHKPEHLLAGFVLLGAIIRDANEDDEFPRQIYDWAVKSSKGHVRFMVSMLAQEFESFVFPELCPEKPALDEEDRKSLEELSELLTKGGNFLLAAQNWYRWRLKVRNEAEMEDFANMVEPLSSRMLAVHAKIEALANPSKAPKKAKRVQARKQLKRKYKAKSAKEPTSSSTDDAGT
ncbi:MAG: hypothetical protein PHS79_02550 [Patescibacteria group bacterium]|nr:hypothetical protein [Patescibacteria group bacterium]